MSQARLSVCMLIAHKDHNNTIQVYSVTVMTHVIALEDGKFDRTSEPITPAFRCGAGRKASILRHDPKLSKCE